MRMGVKMLIPFNFGITRTIQIKQKRCKRLYSNTFHLFLTILNSDIMFSNYSLYNKPGLMQMLTGLLTIVFFSSCQKVIDVDIKNAEKKYVVEAIVTEEQGASKVLLSTTKNVSEDNSFPGVSGAVVTITDNAGNSTVFTETIPGVYTAPAFTGSVGKTYSLQVDVSGETFTAL